MSSLRWKKFFVDSGLPPDICENYAVVFSENRIRFDMLEELNKEILYDMGIKKLGDVISILRHAKEVHSNSYREKVFATDESKDVSKQDINSTYIKADSTIPTSFSKKTTSETKRIVLPQQQEQQQKHQQRKESFSRVVVNKESPIQTSSATSVKVIRKTALPLTKEPIILRNLTGLHTSSVGRNVTGLDPVNLPVSRKRPVQPPNEEMIDFAPKVAKSSMNSSNLVVRNRIEAQNRLSNFSKEIQKVISSNGPSRAPASLSSHSGSIQNFSSQPSIKARLTLNQADSTTYSNNQNSSLRRNINVKSRLGNHPTAASTSTVKGKLHNFYVQYIYNFLCYLDRLGQKSVFSRVTLQSSNPKSSSVFQRLGT